MILESSVTMVGLRCFRLGLLAVATTWLSGCASYYLHYASFSATNSSGDPREFHLTWKTAEYPSWWIASNEATPVELKTQCSKRVWKMMPAADSGCGKGITACGQPGLDLNSQGQPITSGKTVCVSISDSLHHDQIADLGSNVEVTVSCFPATTKLQQGDETVGTDYLRASVVPYSIQTRKVPLYGLNSGPPPLDEKSCPQQ